MEKVNLWVKKSIAADTEVTLGQAVKASSLPVTLASDHDAVAATLAVLPDTAASDLSHIRTKVDLITACNTGAIVGAVSISSNLPDTTANDLAAINQSTDATETAVESLNTKIPALVTDDIEDALVTIEMEHFMVHQEKAFRVGGVTGSLSTNDTYVVHILTPAGKKVHLRQYTIGTVAYKIDFYENPTLSANGTGITAYNRDRNSNTAPDMTVFYTPTVTGGANGTLLSAKRAGSGTTSSSMNPVNEWILKPSEDYLFIFTALANTMYITWWLTWYSEVV